MNIKDLPQGSYNVVSTPTNINQLPQGSYTVTAPTTKQPDYASMGVTKNKDGIYSSPTFLQGLEQAGIGIANTLGSQAIGLGKWVVNALKPSSNTVFNQKATPAQLAQGDVPYNQAIQTGTDLQNQMAPQNQAQQGGATAANVGEILLPLAGTAADVITKAPSIAKGGFEAIAKMAAGKTEEEILAISSEDVYKLNPSEQKVWYDNAEKGIKSEGKIKIGALKEQSDIAKTGIESSSGITKQQISEDLQSKMATTDKQAADLEKELSQRANKNVEDLRQPARQLAKDKSVQFGQIRDEAIAGKEDVNIKKIQLSKTIDETVSDPNVAAIVKKQLGIEGTGRGGNITLGEIYDKTSQLRESVGNYNPSDYANNQAIKVLNNIMKQNGVDFSAANKMWSEWAPQLERIDSSFDMYNKSGLTTDTQANKLINAAKGVDAGNAKFIKTIEDETGQPLTDNLKETLSKMSSNEKTSLANKAAATQQNLDNEALRVEQLKSQQIQDDLAKNKITQDQANKLDALNSKKYSDLRKAWKGRIIKWAIGGGAGTLFTAEGIRRIVTGNF
jgi:hypothetical protein